ncbi:MAG: Mu transposase C-terminal domain-containing protein [Thiotrichales bacterium]|jgi:putative transposase|nr:Mu transposase C-terminal domain-containing protein [Thiotrichales bacterium]
MSNHITIGSKVYYQGTAHQVVAIIDVHTLSIKSENTHDVIQVDVESLSTTPPTDETPEVQDLSNIDAAAWKSAQDKLDMIKPVLDAPKHQRRSLIMDIANNRDDVSVPTLYRWLQQYEASGKLSSLLKATRSDKNKSRLTDEVESLITEKINTSYLRSQKPGITALYMDIKGVCVKNGWAVPHRNTIENRVKLLTAAEKAARRDGKKGKQKYEPIQGSFPNAINPLDYWQLDHTPLDVIVVSEHTGEPLGRPYITTIIDVATRMVAGFYLSFDHPSSYGTGMALVHAMLPKEKWLKEMGVAGEWPIYGKPRTILVDNAKELRGNMLSRAGQEYGITIEYRPVARPHFGGAIERLYGTLAKEIHKLPGTTFSNVKQRGEYRSEDKSALTIKELEAWLTDYIVNIYHQTVHSALNTTPLIAYGKAILGDETHVGVGLPEVIKDVNRLRLDFMPYETRTIQRYGIALEGVHYYHDVLNRWVREKNPDKPDETRKFTVRYDPRDMSQVFFFDPEVNKYYPIPYRNLSHPVASLWEIREARRYLVEQGNNEREITETMIFEAYERLNQRVAESVKRTNKLRRKAANKDIHRESAITKELGIKIHEMRDDSTAKAQQDERPISRATIKPFEDVDE